MLILSFLCSLTKQPPLDSWGCSVLQDWSNCSTKTRGSGPCCGHFSSHSRPYHGSASSLHSGRPPHLWSGRDADLWPDYKGRWHQHSSEQQLPVFHLVPPGAFPLGHGWGLARNHAVLPQLAWHSLWSWGDQISNYYFGSYFLTFKFFSLTTPAKRKVVGATLPMFISSPSSSSVPS